MAYLEILTRTQLVIVATSFILGLIFGAFYDIISFAYILCGLLSLDGRKTVERKGTLPFCCRLFADLSVSLVMGAAFAVFVYRINDGQFRGGRLCPVAGHAVGAGDVLRGPSGAVSQGGGPDSGDRTRRVYPFDGGPGIPEPRQADRAARRDPVPRDGGKSRPEIPTEEGAGSDGESPAPAGGGYII